MTAEPAARPSTIDLRPLFDPRSVAVVGASPRSWIAETVRDNLRVMGSATRCHFVNPKYEELHGQPCYPSLEALPERVVVLLDDHPDESLKDDVTTAVKYCPAFALSMEEED